MTSLTQRAIPAYAYVAIAAVVIAAAAAPIAIRQAQIEGLPSVLIIALRLTLATTLMAPFILRRDRPALKSVPRDQWPWLIGAGVTHAAGLITLFFSLEYTTVLVNTVLRRTSPFWVIWLELLLLHAIFTRRVWFGVFLTIVGSIVVGIGTAGGDLSSAGSRPLLGASLALVNAVVNALYLLIGRRVKDVLPAVTYSWIVFGTAAVVAWVGVLAMQLPILGYTMAGYLWVLVVTFIAQFAGHIPINIALQHFSATYLSIALQMAVALAGVFGFFFLNEVPTVVQIVGSIIVVVGVFLASSRS